MQRKTIKSFSKQAHPYLQITILTLKLPLDTLFYNCTYTDVWYEPYDTKLIVRQRHMPSLLNKLQSSLKIQYKLLVKTPKKNYLALELKCFYYRILWRRICLDRSSLYRWNCSTLPARCPDRNDAAHAHHGHHVCQCLQHQWCSALEHHLRHHHGDTRYGRQNQ